MGINENIQTVQFGVFETDEVFEPLKTDAIVISLDPIDITLDRFRTIFFNRDGNEFSLNNVIYINEYDLTKRTIDGYPFSLSSSIIDTYIENSGLIRSCIDPCSIIKISNQLSKYSYLTKMCYPVCNLTFHDILMELIRKYKSTSPVNFDDNICHNFEFILKFPNQANMKTIFIKLVFVVEFVNGSSSVNYAQQLANNFNTMNEKSGL